MSTATIPFPAPRLPRARRYADVTADCRVWQFGPEWRIQERRSRYFLRSRHRRKLEYIVQRLHAQYGCWDNVSRHETLAAATAGLQRSMGGAT